ncbi:hypothetical protein D3C87_447710 [compost metagenome]
MISLLYIGFRALEALSPLVKLLRSKSTNYYDYLELMPKFIEIIEDVLIEMDQF